MADLVEPIPQFAIGDVAAAADRYLAKAGDATLMLVSCDNWVDVVRNDGFETFHGFMNQAIRVANLHIPEASTVMRLESDQFGIVTSGLSNREGRALAMRIQLQVAGAAPPGGTQPIMSIAVGHILPGRATSLEVINRAKDILKQSYTQGSVVSVSSAPLADPWDDPDTKPIPTLVHGAYPIQALPIVRAGEGEVVAFELCTKHELELSDLASTLEVGQSLAGGLSIHVNIPSSWITTGMINEVMHRLEFGPSNAMQLCVEISAKGFNQKGARFGEFVKLVRQLGCIVALDDVGYGATTLEQIVEIDPDVIKFSPTVLHELRGQWRGRAARLVDMFAANQCLLIGLGVESEADEQLLTTAGIMLAQGPMYGPPNQ